MSWLQRPRCWWPVPATEGLTTSSALAQQRQTSCFVGFSLFTPLFIFLTTRLRAAASVCNAGMKGEAAGTVLPSRKLKRLCGERRLVTIVLIIYYRNLMLTIRRILGPVRALQIPQSARAANA